MFWKKKKSDSSDEAPARLPEEFPDEDEKSPNYQLLSDYAYWFVNYQ